MIDGEPAALKDNCRNQAISLIGAVVDAAIRSI